MVDVSEKPPTARVAVAEGKIHMQPETLRRIKERSVKKGDVLAVADCAAVLAAKKTSDIVPMCHPIALMGVEVAFEEEKKKNSAALKVIVTAKTTGPTGVEMEALTGVSAALLTIYDMCKSIERGMTISGISLVEKKGGRSGHWIRRK
jgi:cyclic pyranopterin phosphate synthase